MTPAISTTRLVSPRITASIANSRWPMFVWRESDARAQNNRTPPSSLISRSSRRGSTSVLGRPASSQATGLLDDRLGHQEQVRVLAPALWAGRVASHFGVQ